MKTLAVSPIVPWPLDCGGRIRTFELLRRAARITDLELWCVEQPDLPVGAVELLRDRGLALRTFPRSPLPHHRRPWRSRPERWFWSDALSSELRCAVRTGGFDVVHLDDVALTRCLPADDARRSRAVLVCHHHKLEPDVRAPLAHTAAERLEVRRLAALERAAFRRFERHVVCAAEDRARLVERYGPTAVSVVPNGFDPRRIHPVDGVPRGRDRVLFLGSLNYAPNVDAIERLVRTILPAVRAARPNAHLDVVGSAPPLHVRALAGDDVRVFGSVPDPLPHLVSAAVMAVPLVAGTGSRLKVVEALAAECPLVATPLAAEGFELRPDHHLRTARTDAGLARALIDALAQPLAARARARRGRQHVLERFTWDRLATRLVGAWEDALRARSRDGLARSRTGA